MSLLGRNAVSIGRPLERCLSPLIARRKVPLMPRRIPTSTIPGLQRTFASTPKRSSRTALEEKEQEWQEEEEDIEELMCDAIRAAQEQDFNEQEKLEHGRNIKRLEAELEVLESHRCLCRYQSSMMWDRGSVPPHHQLVRMADLVDKFALATLSVWRLYTFAPSPDVEMQDRVSRCSALVGMACRYALWRPLLWALIGMRGWVH